jgi:2-amino-4-hydroxy-6-hydroxymethyldihydropteridine diphosphokinase/dihydropteroate synthase
LDLLQSVENKIGRVKVIDKGPRNIDLDILMYTHGSAGEYKMVDWRDERLQVPHKLMLEREFVLKPLVEYVLVLVWLCDGLTLCSLLSDKDNPSLGYSHYGDLSRSLIFRSLEKLRSDKPLSPLTRIGAGLPNLTPHDRERPTQIMSILNVTPDSFSDGGKNYDVNKDTLKQTILDHVAKGATIIDVGGQSTRPGSIQVNSSEELSRVLPAIHLIRSLNLRNVAISVDTYRADVAEAAINAGAHIINDVSAGLMDENMLPTAAKLGCAICLMHMRGTPETMNSFAKYPNGVIETVGCELLERVRAAEDAGIRRWRIILDPGIGFAKTQAHNLELLRRFDELRRYPGLENHPWLVGTSRKAFIGRITGVKEAKERVWGTAASVAAAVQGGADIVRVHDVKEMAQVTRMADAIWRG